MNKLPIDPIILEKRAAIPGLIAELSYHDETKAIKYMRIWGERRMPITSLFSTLNLEISNVKKLVAQ
ncbi:hypothetical protein [Paenisporosarcina sp. OV554]|uniref:hypothetical protein n=1 Tax=Paenisporosarcina sp. OV554 TaxID=2135694 RepID=UPI000D35104E|nr:hypothetical protein [Paenisporosarcina sp. OV554]PUB12588.1 hypothetical protein C8K15_10987 [Paenisporosarcina sp. OV554]